MFKKALNYLANLKIAIVLLLIIAAFSSIGSFLEQNKDVEFYQTFYPAPILGIPSWKIILFFGFDNTYNTWWFLFFLSLLVLSLACCTIFQQIPTLKFSRRYYFYKTAKQFNKLLVKFKSNQLYKPHLSYTLLNQQYSIFYQYHSIYAYKGLISRLGPIIVHLSLICILFGSTLGALKGFNSQELIPKTELFHIQNIIKNGVFALVPQKTFRINDFWSTHTTIGEIKQFYSDVSFLDSKGLEIKRKTISVNNPLLVNNLLIYQTDWTISGVRVLFKNNKASETIFQLPILKINDSSQKIWVSSLSWDDKNAKGFLVLIKNNRGQLSFFNSKGEFIKNINIGEIYSLLNGDSFNFIDIITSTGLQIKCDPGVKFIYFGFFFLILSSLISYLSFSEFWILKLPRKVLLGGKTNRSKILLNIEFLKIKQSFLS